MSATTWRRAWRREVRWGMSRWSVVSAGIVLLLAMPVFVLLSGLIGDAGPEWSRIKSDLVGAYVRNSLVIGGGVALLAMVFGIPAAWVVATREFRGRRVFEWLLALPLAIPSYVAAYTYAEVRDALIGPLIWIRKTWGVDAYLVAESVFRHGLLIVLLAAVLYPYVYLAARAAFAQQGRSLIEASRMLGAGPMRTFFRVALPVARPAIVAGVVLVVMEVLNDYGAVLFFGIPTLTVGIFRTWFSSGDHLSAIRLAGWLLVGIVAVVGFERWLRGRRRFHDAAQDSTVLARQPARGAGLLMAWLVCLVPLALGLIFPVQRLVRWSIQSAEKSWDLELVALLGMSVGLASEATLIIVVIAVLVAFSARLHGTRLMRSVSRLAVFGYAMPGAVIAVGVMVVFGWLDGHINALADGWSGIRTGLIFSSSVYAILFAYTLRYLAVAFQPVESNLERLCGEHDEAARSLGCSPGQTLWRVNLPLMRVAIAAAAMLVFVDVLKELPLTLILRPFNFETLATRTYGLASEGRLAECATPALIVVVIGMIGMTVLNRVMSRSRSR